MLHFAESSNSSGVLSSLTDANDTIFDNRNTVVGDVREVHVMYYTSTHSHTCPCSCVYMYEYLCIGFVTCVFIAVLG